MANPVASVRIFGLGPGLPGVTNTIVDNVA